jgi:hypothetical protein
MSKTLVLLALLAVASQAISIKWTGYGGDNQWTNKVNWNPDQVPSTGDDVQISEGVVQVTISTGCNSLVMGDSFNGPANLTLFQTFFIGSGGMQVMGNGNVFINAGSASVTGTVTIGGQLYFQSGVIGGQWTITSKGTADLSGPAQKSFIGCQFQSSTTSFVFDGVMALNQSSQVSLTAGATLVMNGNAAIQQQDTTSVLLDTSLGKLTYTGGGTLQVQAPVKLGVFDFQGGNLTLYDEITFANAFIIPSGSYISSVGSAVVDMSAGVSGSGVLTAAGTSLLLGATSISGYLNIVGGNTTFSATGSNVSVLTLSGGFTIVNKAVVAGQVNFMAGNIIGTATLTAGQLLSNNQGFNLNAAVVVNVQASLGGLLSFGSSGALTISASAKAQLLSSMTFTGVPAMTVTNNGAFAVASPVVFQNINLAGAGTMSVSSTLSVQTAQITQSAISLSGSGVFKGANTEIVSVGKVAASPKVKAVIGTYTLYCTAECDDVTTAGIPTSPFRFTASA